MECAFLKWLLVAFRSMVLWGGKTSVVLGGSFVYMV